MKIRHYVVTGVLVACGGAITGVDGNKDVGTLSPTDKDQLCRDVANYVQTSISANDFKKFVCGFSSTSTEPGACQSKFNACMADPSKNVNFGAMINCSSFNTYLLNCTGVSVAQFSDCYKQYVEVIKTWAAHMPLCDKAAQQSAQLDVLNHISNQCLQIILKCSNSSTGMDAGAPDASPPPQDAGTGG